MRLSLTTLAVIFGLAAGASVEAQTTTWADQRITNSLGMELVLIPAGSFDMGSAPDPNRNPNESPVHTVTLEAFHLGIHEVTVEQYSRFLDATGRAEPVNSVNPPNMPWALQIENPNRPVVNVSWEDATAFCEWLTQTEGQGTYTLPTEAQWEYACRAGTTTDYSVGDTLTPEHANYLVSNHGGPVDVGSYAPNPWGLFDMHGNVWEWCQDSWHDGYDGAPTDGSAWLDPSGDRRVVRGGSWGDYFDSCRSTSRLDLPASDRAALSGFRVSRTP